MAAIFELDEKSTKRRENCQRKFVEQNILLSSRFQAIFHELIQMQSQLMIQALQMLIRGDWKPASNMMTVKSRTPNYCNMVQYGDQHDDQDERSGTWNQQ